MEEKKDNEAVDEFNSWHVRNYEFRYLSSKDCNLINSAEVNSLFENIRPTFVIHLAARVGGLFANMSDKVGFYEDNMSINMNVIKACHKFRVRRLICLLSTCIYPDKISYPIKEVDLQ